MPLSPDNSTVIQHTVTNPLASPIFVNDATVTATIFDKDSNELTGLPANLPYVTGSDGIYRQTFEPFDDLIVGQLYKVVITVLGIDGLESECESNLRATDKIC